MKYSKKMETNIRLEQIFKQHFTSPKRISPFYDDNVKIPRKLKKKVKCFCGIYYKGLTNGQRLWYYMEYRNPDYKRYLIKRVIFTISGLSHNCR